MNKEKKRKPQTLNYILIEYHKDNPLPHKVEVLRYRDYLVKECIIPSTVGVVDFRKVMQSVFKNLDVKPLRPTNRLSFIDRTGEADILII